MASDKINPVNTCGICEEIIQEASIPIHNCLQGYKHFMIDNNRYFYPICDNGAIIRRSAMDNNMESIVLDESPSNLENSTNVGHVLDKSYISPLSETQKLYQWHRKCEHIIQEYSAENLRKHNIAIMATVGAVIAWAIGILKKKRRYKKKRTWITEFFRQRRQYGFYYTALPILKLEDLRFRNYLRMNATQFEELLQLVAPRITRQYTIREPIEAEQRLCICLRYI